MVPRVLPHVVGWIKMCGQVSVKFEEGSEAILVYVRTWDRDTLRRVRGTVLSRYSGETGRDAFVPGQHLSVLGPSVSLVSLVGGSHVLHDTYVEFVGNRYREMLAEYTIFQLRVLKRCFLKFVAVLFGSLDPLAMSELIMVMLKGAEHRHWMASRKSPRRAVVS